MTRNDLQFVVFICSALVSVSAWAGISQLTDSGSNVVSIVGRLRVKPLDQRKSFRCAQLLTISPQKDSAKVDLLAQLIGLNKADQNSLKTLLEKRKEDDPSHAVFKSIYQNTLDLRGLLEVAPKLEDRSQENAIKELLRQSASNLATIDAEAQPSSQETAFLTRLNKAQALISNLHRITRENELSFSHDLLTTVVVDELARILSEYSQIPSYMDHPQMQLAELKNEANFKHLADFESNKIRMLNQFNMGLAFELQPGQGGTFTESGTEAGALKYVFPHLLDADGKTLTYLPNTTIMAIAESSAQLKALTKLIREIFILTFNLDENAKGEFQLARIFIYPFEQWAKRMDHQVAKTMRKWHRLSEDEAREELNEITAVYDAYMPDAIETYARLRLAYGPSIIDETGVRIDLRTAKPVVLDRPLAAKAGISFLTKTAQLK